MRQQKVQVMHFSYINFKLLICVESCLSFVPEKGTVGASGDLAPLAHLALGIMGEGRMWSPKCGWAESRFVCRLKLNIKIFWPADITLCAII